MPEEVMIKQSQMRMRIVSRAKPLLRKKGPRESLMSSKVKWIRMKKRMRILKMMAKTMMKTLRRHSLRLLL